MEPWLWVSFVQPRGMAHFFAGSAARRFLASLFVHPALISQSSSEFHFSSSESLTG